MLWGCCGAPVGCSRGMAGNYRTLRLWGCCGAVVGLLDITCVCMEWLGPNAKYYFHISVAYYSI